MQTEKTEGIALKTVPYKDGQKILTIFAEKQGLTTLLVKRLSLKKIISKTSKLRVWNWK